MPENATLFEIIENNLKARNIFAFIRFLILVRHKYFPFEERSPYLTLSTEAKNEVDSSFCEGGPQPCSQGFSEKPRERG